MKIGHYQCECTPGDVEANVAKVLKGLEHAEAEGIEIMMFPESFLQGYFSDVNRVRENTFRTDGPEIAEFLQRTARFRATFMVGYNELRGGDLYNTVVIAEEGRMLGTYSKAFPCYEHFVPGREFPVFKRGDVTFGVVICADGGYIEPARILAMKGAQIVFAPHYNYIGKEGLLTHYIKVRYDHAARAVENNVWFMRGNNVVSGYDEGVDREGVGYGDSYLVNPQGKIVVRSTLHKECFITADVDFSEPPELRRTLMSARELGPVMLQAAEDNPRTF